MVCVPIGSLLPSTLHVCSFSQLEGSFSRRKCLEATSLLGYVGSSGAPTRTSASVPLSFPLSLAPVPITPLRCLSCPSVFLCCPYSPASVCSRRCMLLFVDLPHWFWEGKIESPRNGLGLKCVFHLTEMSGEQTSSLWGEWHLKIFWKMWRRVSPRQG